MSKVQQKFKLSKFETTSAKRVRRKVNIRKVALSQHHFKKWMKKKYDYLGKRQ